MPFSKRLEKSMLLESPKIRPEPRVNYTIYTLLPVTFELLFAHGYSDSHIKNTKTSGSIQ